MGNNTTTDSPVPVAVSNFSGVVAISGGTKFTCALTSQGTVECWGDNMYGELGYDTSNSANRYFSPVPVTVSGLSDVIAISSGDEFTCALASKGAVECWGKNYSAALYSGGSPLTAISGLSGITAISSSVSHSCAQSSQGDVYCWGSNIYGELGVGGANIADFVSQPTLVSGFTSPVLSVQAAGNSTYFFLANGTVAATGEINFLSMVPTGPIMLSP